MTIRNRMLPSAALTAALTVASPAMADAGSTAFSFSQVRLLVCDFPAVKHFYRDLLALPVVFEGLGYIEFRTAEGATIGVFEKQRMPAVEDGCQQARKPHGDAVLVLRVSDVDEAAAYLGRQGIETVVPPEDRPGWGLRTAHVRDPAGNLVEVLGPLAEPAAD